VDLERLVAAADLRFPPRQRHVDVPELVDRERLSDRLDPAELFEQTTERLLRDAEHLDIEILRSAPQESIADEPADGQGAAGVRADQSCDRQRLIDNRVGHPFIMSVPPSASPHDVRLSIFNRAAETTHVPQAAEIASGLGLPIDAVRRALVELADGRVIVLTPQTTDIWAAAPFAAAPSNFRVEVKGKTYWAVCIWDALGIPAAIDADAAVVRTTCGDCGEAMHIELRDGVLAHAPGVVHFGVPARHFWDDIIFT
jgi:Alkylmercury lyase